MTAPYKPGTSVLYQGRKAWVLDNSTANVASLRVIEGPFKSPYSLSEDVLTTWDKVSVPPVDEWKTVVLHSNWGYWDQIDGKTVKPGNYRIRWPDGSETINAVVVKNGSFTYSDMGHTETGSDVKAYAKVNYRGAEVEIRLVGLKVKPYDVQD